MADTVPGGAGEQGAGERPRLVPETRKYAAMGSRVPA